MKFQPGLIPRFNNDYNFNDFLYGIKSIITSNCHDLRKLSAAFDNSDIFFTNNGRSSLYIILRSMNFPRNSKIGVPLYSCTVVFDAIIKAGYIPCFIDIDLSTYTMDPRDLENKISELSAIVVIHTFGHPADMDEIKKVANSVPIIEDCAHSLLSEYKGKMTGTLGDASFFSLAKYISAGGGGMIILNNKELKVNIEKEIHLIKSPKFMTEIKHSIFIYLFSLLYHKPWYGGIAFFMGSIIDKKLDITNKRSFEVTKGKKGDLCVLSRKISSFKEKVQIQRKNSMTLLNELQNINLGLPYENRDIIWNYYLFPVLFYSKINRDKATEFLRKVGIDTVILFNNIPNIARQSYGYKYGCPKTEEFVDRVLIIPNYYSLNSNELLKISIAVKKLGGNA